VYSIIETAKANGFAPFRYRKYLFETLPNINVSDPAAIDALLPWSKTLPSEVKSGEQVCQLKIPRLMPYTKCNLIGVHDEVVAPINCKMCSP
jgi:hypothetical protein